MSLDVYLIERSKEGSNPHHAIFIREDGMTKEISIEEWNRRFPDREPVTFEKSDSDEVYSANITHNLGKMANEAGLYEFLWRPDEIGITKAKELIDPLREGLHKLELDPNRFSQYNPENGWGSYEGLVSFVQRYLDACYEYSEATIEISR